MFYYAISITHGHGVLEKACSVEQHRFLEHLDDSWYTYFGQFKSKSTANAQTDSIEPKKFSIWENICKMILENKYKWNVVIGIGIFFIYLTSHIQIKQELKENGNQLTKLQMKVNQMVILSGSYEYNEKTNAHMAETIISLNLVLFSLFGIILIFFQHLIL